MTLEAFSPGTILNKIVPPTHPPTLVGGFRFVQRKKMHASSTNDIIDPSFSELNLMIATVQ